MLTILKNLKSAFFSKKKLFVPHPLFYNQKNFKYVLNKFGWMNFIGVMGKQFFFHRSCPF